MKEENSSLRVKLLIIFFFIIIVDSPWCGLHLSQQISLNLNTGNWRVECMASTGWSKKKKTSKRSKKKIIKRFSMSFRWDVECCSSLRRDGERMRNWPCPTFATSLLSRKIGYLSLSSSASMLLCDMHNDMRNGENVPQNKSQAEQQTEKKVKEHVYFWHWKVLRSFDFDWFTPSCHCLRAIA